jgi:hypothetical protein
MKTIQEKLTKIQKTLKAPKGNFNSFGKYKYRSCEDILEAVKPLLEDVSLTLSDEIISVGNRYYIKATASLKEGDDEIIVSAFARESEDKKGMDDSQITGTASSYARKYALNGLFLIDDTKDADTDDYHKQTDIKDVKEVNIYEMTKSNLDRINDEDKIIETIEKIKSSKKLTDTQKEELVKLYSDKIERILNELE